MALHLELGRRCHCCQGLRKCRVGFHPPALKSDQQHLHTVVLEVCSTSSPLLLLGTQIIVKISLSASPQRLTHARSYTGDDVLADVSYDTYLGDTPNGGASTEVMIWLDNPGDVAPMSYTNSPITSITIGGTTFDLYKGPRGGHGAWAIYTFVAQSIQSDYSGDLMDFFNYLTEKEGISDTQYLQSIGAGMEAFTGSNVQFTSAISLDVDGSR